MLFPGFLVLFSGRTIEKYFYSIYVEAVSEKIVKVLVTQLYLCDPMDGSPPGSPVPGILQARTLEWIAISFSNA